jgi:murein DD-endopeptidase MepM/ murein hydrolase activator NlpD
VTCAGTGVGPGANGGGCAAFGDTDGGGAGRIEVQFDNGVVLIYGHSSASLLQPGQRVNPGQPVALSGGMYGPHIHLEARVRDPSTPSGWRIVDPRTVVGGFTPGTGTGPGGGFGGGAFVAPPQTQHDLTRMALQGQLLGGGQPAPGSYGAGGDWFHNLMVSQFR